MVGREGRHSQVDEPSPSNVRSDEFRSDLNGGQKECKVARRCGAQAQLIMEYMSE
jgi:hypothetical protein